MKGFDFLLHFEEHIKSIQKPVLVLANFGSNATIDICQLEGIYSRVRDC